jgi:Ran-interacting Mog1 protein
LRPTILTTIKPEIPPTPRNHPISTKPSISASLQHHSTTANEKKILQETTKMAIPPITNTLSHRPTPLFGGAIIANLPSSTIDASTVRPVPDSQEVWVQAEPQTGNETSIIFDILEYVEPDSHADNSAAPAPALALHGTNDDSSTNPEEATNLAALDIHLSEIVTPGDRLRVLSRDSHIALPQFPPGTPALGVAVEVTGPRVGGAGALKLWVTLVRLKEKRTDLVVTVNVPRGSEEGLEEIVRGIWDSLEVRDWGLFVQDS